MSTDCRACDMARAVVWALLSNALVCHYVYFKIIYYFFAGWIGQMWELDLKKPLRPTTYKDVTWLAILWLVHVDCALPCLAKIVGA